jgi:hypothetical protein
MRTALRYFRTQKKLADISENKGELTALFIATMFHPKRRNNSRVYTSTKAFTPKLD